MAARPRKISDEEILKEACECFLQHGPGVSTQIIADRLHISQAALFKRFHTKEELMISALLPPEHSPAMDWLEKGPLPGPFRPQLEEMIRVLWQTFQTVFPRLSILFMSGIRHEQIHSRFKTIPVLKTTQLLAEWLDLAQAQGQIRKDGDSIIWAHVCMGAIHSRVVIRFNKDANFIKQSQKFYQKMEDDDLFCQSTADLLWQGMAESER
jgi:AcrR family transcriptional regulator